MEEALYWYWLVNIEGIGNATQRKLLAQCHSNPKEVFEMSDEQLRAVLTDSRRRAFERSRDIFSIQRSYQRLHQSGTKFVAYTSEDYPEQFRELTDPPFGFYLRGRLPNPGYPCLAIVGSRTCTEYGKRITIKFARELARSGIQIISGLAAGIDTASHRGALGYGYTAGILGGGIDSVYPEENYNLYREMYQKGGVLSEYNLGIKPKSGMFPMRNRLIAGMADAVLVIEARRKSGSLITADQALSQNKDVMALPGRVTDELSSGTLDLIYQGASLVRNVQDILDIVYPAYRMRRGQTVKKERTVKDSDSRPNIYRPQEEEFSWNRSHNDSIKDDSMTAVLTEKEQNICHRLDPIHPVSLEELIEQCLELQMDVQELRAILLSLELKGVAVQLRQNMYIRGQPV